MPKLHVKKGEEVVIISGPERPFVDPESGEVVVKRGRILQVYPAKQRVLIEGCRMIKKHMRRSQLNPQGKIVEQEGTIHASNVMRLTDYEARATKRGIKIKQS